MIDEKNLFLLVFDRKKNKIIKHSLEDYILQILAFELPQHFHKEVLKAHAIMIRTYIIKKMKLFDGEGCQHHNNVDLCNDPKHCIGALPLDEIPIKTKKQLRQVIQSTENKVITFQGKLIQPYYHDTCGGSTENSENILGNTLQYTRRVLCDYCKDTSPHWQSHIEFSLEELEEKLNITFPALVPTAGIEIEKILEEVERDQYGRVIGVRAGGKSIKGTDFKEKLGLNATRFGWQPTGIRFFVQGKGNGLGLCRQGAEGLAQRGKSAQEILKYYFTGIEVENPPQWSINFPLKGKILLIDAGHGGKEIGIAKESIIEKERNLEIARILNQLLKKAGAKAVLIRQEDEYVPLGDRLEISNSLKPHFMLSIHGNDNFNMGKITQIYSYPGDRDAIKLGKCIIEELRRIGLNCWDITEADLYLLRESKKSALCLDIGYFFMGSRKKNTEIAQAIYKGMLCYWGINNHDNMEIELEKTRNTRK